MGNVQNLFTRSSSVRHLVGSVLASVWDKEKPIIAEKLLRSSPDTEHALLSRLQWPNVLFEGEDSLISNTILAQPLIFAHQMVLWDQLKDKTIHADKTNVFLGHSLGELSALCASGALDWEDGFWLACKRGQAMQDHMKTKKEEDEERGDKMVALWPAEGVSIKEVVDSLQDDLSRLGLVCDIANFNSPSQIVISGDKRGVSFVLDHLKSHKLVRRSRGLNVSAPFHSRIMIEASKQFKNHLDSISLRSPLFPVISNVTAQPMPENVEEIKDLMVKHIYSPVMWHQSIEFIKQARSSESTEFVEIGLQGVLQGLLRQIDPKLSCVSFGNVDQLPASSSSSSS